MQNYKSEQEESRGEQEVQPVSQEWLRILDNVHNHETI